MALNLTGKKGGDEKMRYSEQFMEHIEYAFAAFGRTVLRNAAISDFGRKQKRPFLSGGSAASFGKGLRERIGMESVFD